MTTTKVLQYFNGNQQLVLLMMKYSIYIYSTKIIIQHIYIILFQHICLWIKRTGTNNFFSIHFYKTFIVSNVNLNYFSPCLCADKLKKTKVKKCASRKKKTI
jgi:hypothetical protein